MSNRDNKLLIGNWKLNPTTFKEAKSLSQKVIKGAATLRNVEVVICPPTLYLQSLRSSYRGRKVSFGAQSFYPQSVGAHTGELSPTQLVDSKVSHVIIGHSERRQPTNAGGAGIDDAQVSLRVLSALRYELVPVVCIGEKVRDNSGSHLNFIESQLVGSLAGVSARNLEKVVIAYEPVWAIGGQSKNAITAHDLYEMKLYIQKIIAKHWNRPVSQKVTILYGGSVKPENAANLSAEGNMDGFLVGGASLKAESFLAIGKVM